MRHWDFVSSCDLHLHLASTNNAAAYYLPLGHQTVRAPPEKNCHSQIMRRQQELFGEGSRSGLQNRCSSFCQDVKMVDAGMARNHVCYQHLLNSAWKREEIKAWLGQRYKEAVATEEDRGCCVGFRENVTAT